ncbi:MAG: hypothetical protein M1830_001525 [Pleopsidium flavum]|nr:MAG: hypothetical protein M1830_001525 [Pleopsidium flavum]
MLSLWICLSSLAVGFAQSISPSNDSSTLPPAGSPQLILKTSQTSMVTMVNINPLTHGAGLQGTLQQLQAVNVTGTLVLTTPSSATSLKDSDIAYISCDPFSYTSSNIDAASTVNIAANNHPAAILLYSTQSTHCYIASQGSFANSQLYTMTDGNASYALANGLKTHGPTQGSTSITLDQSTVQQNGTAGSPNGNPLGPSPTTAVAMIILYSITGIITALFLIIIVTGAVRAHRHPERYGPRNVLGRPRQSRARGIARAMLETIPIVKFGEKEDDKPSGDVELGATGATNSTRGGEAAQTEGEGQGSPTDNAVGNDEHSSNQDAVNTAAATTTASTQNQPEDTNADNGLACSVCTDDFIKGQDLRVLPCNHKFHPECIDPWLLNVSGTCPLCRIDLRPTTSHENGEGETTPDGEGLPPPLTDFNNDNAGFGTPEGGPTSRRQRNGLSLYLQHTLNIRRMHDATPEERLAALRRLRTVNRASHPTGSSTEDGSGESSRGNRLSMRLRDAFRIRTRPEGGSHVDDSATPAPVAAGSQNPASTGRIRTGTFAMRGNSTLPDSSR